MESQVIRAIRQGCRIAIVWGLLAAGSGDARAQQVATDPASTHIFPAGGQRGTTVSVRVGGECLPPQTRIRWWADGIDAPTVLGEKLPFRGEPSLRRKPGELHVNYPKEWESSVAIAADAALGTRLWRLSCGRGGTGGRVFIVGDLPEFVERESNSTPRQAQRVSLPVTVNGQIDGERDMDYYVFPVEAGQVISAEVAAQRLGSPLDAIVEFHDPSGRRVRPQMARLSGDSALAFRAESAGDYRLSVAHINYQGGPHFVYRITLLPAPAIVTAFPGGWQAGQSRAIDFLTLGGAEGVSLLETVTFDATPNSEFRWRGASSGNGVPLAAGALPEAVETEPNDSPESSTAIVVGTTVNGRFQSATDMDCYAFAARPELPLRIECQTWPKGGAALPMMEIVDARGDVLAAARSVDAADRACRVDPWTAPAEGTYFIRLRDLRHGSAGGPEYVYRLTVTAETADFSLTLPVDQVNIVPAGRAEIELRIARSGGFAAVVDVTAEGLPDGVTAESLQLAPGQPGGKLVLNAAADARPQDASLRIVGTAPAPVATAGDATSASPTLTRIAAATHLGHDAEGVGLELPEVDHVQLTVLHKPVFRLFCNEAYQYAYRGTVYPYLMEVERLDGFDGPITLEVADRQNKDLDGIEVLETTIAPGQNSVLLPIYLPETMHINVQAHSNVYAQGHVSFTDRWGQPQSLLVVSTMRCMIRPLPTVARLKALDRVLTLPRGESAACRLRLERTANFAGAVHIELLPQGKMNGISAESVALSGDQDECEVIVHAAADAAIHDDVPLVFRATGDMPGGARLVSEARVRLRWAD
jgi:hypothetical protein